MIHEVKKQEVDGLHPTISEFEGKPDIWLLAFLSTLRDALDMVGVSEAAAVRVTATFRKEKRRRCCSSRWKVRRRNTTPNGR